MARSDGQWRRRAAWIGLICAVGAADLATGQGAERRSGDDFRRQLLAPASVTWTQNPLREALANVGRQWNVAVFLDRRVDPDQRVDFVSPPTATLDRLLSQLTHQLGLGVCYVDSVVYIGPIETANVLATIAEQRYDAARDDHVTFLSHREPLRWSDISEPKAILAELTRGEGNLRWENLDEIPYDLWFAADWPAMPKTHQLSLLLAGFGRSFEWDLARQTMRLVPLPREARLTRDYAVRGDPRAKLAELRREFPQAGISPLGSRLRVVGGAEDHYWIHRAAQDLPSLAPRANGKTEVRYSLRTTATFGELAKALAHRLELTLEVDPRLDAQRATEVTLDVHDATREQLLRALAETIDAEFELLDGRLVLKAK